MSARATIDARAAGSALRVLGRLAGLLQAVLLPLLGPRVTGEEAGLLQRRAVVGLEPDERAGDREAQGPGLAGDAAAVQGGDDVVLVGLLQGDERLLDELLVHLVREVVVERAPVELEVAGARNEADADDGLLAAADDGGGRGHWDTCLISNGCGFWAACGWSGPA